MTETVVLKYLIVIKYLTYFKVIRAYNFYKKKNFVVFFKESKNLINSIKMTKYTTHFY